MNIVERLRDYEYLVTDQSFRIEELETALREALEVIKFLQCNTDDYYDSAREASMQGDKVIDKINAVLGEMK